MGALGLGHARTLTDAPPASQDQARRRGARASPRGRRTARCGPRTAAPRCSRAPRASGTAGARAGARSARRPGRPRRSAPAPRAARRSAPGRRPGASARSRSSSRARAHAEEVARAREQHDADVEALPALDARHDAQDRVLERATRPPGTLGLPAKRAAASEPAREVLGVRAPPRVRRRRLASSSSQTSGSAPTIASIAAVVEPRGQPLVGRRDRAGARQQHVLGDRREGPRPRVGQQRVAVVGVERRAVVDEPQALVPHEQVGVGGRAVDVGTRASNHTTSAASPGSTSRPAAGS